MALLEILFFSSLLFAQPKQQTIVLATPHFRDYYYSKMYYKILDFQIRYARKIAVHDKVEIWTDETGDRKLRKELPNEWVSIRPMHDIWMRDFSTTGPNFESQFRYTAAAQNGDQKRADHVQKRFNTIVGRNKKVSKYKLDGGNVVFAKDKAIVTSRFLQDNSLDYKKAKEVLKKELRVSKVAIIPSDDDEGLAHADGMVSFIEDDVLLVNKYSGKFGKNIMAELKKAFPRTKIVEIPSNPSLEDWEKGISSACGVNINILTTNRAVYVPTFEKKLDKKVLDIIKANTKKHVVSIDASEVCRMGGSARCLTWQY